MLIGMSCVEEEFIVRSSAANAGRGGYLDTTGGAPLSEHAFFPAQLKFGSKIHLLDIIGRHADVVALALQQGRGIIEFDEVDASFLAEALSCGCERLDFGRAVVRDARGAVPCLEGGCDRGSDWRRESGSFVPFVAVWGIALDVKIFFSGGGHLIVYCSRRAQQITIF